MADDAQMWETLNCLPDAVEHMIHGDPDEADSVKASDAVRWAIAEIARLRESLAIFVHAHETGNSVPRRLEAAAKTLVKLECKRVAVKEVGK